MLFYGGTNVTKIQQYLQKSFQSVKHPTPFFFKLKKENKLNPFMPVAIV